MFSLESLCLDTIVENFPRFNFAFTSSKDASMQRNFKFLQRKYSDYLARKLLKDRRNTEEYFGFLINENLKHLEFDYFRNSPYLDSVDEIFCRLPNLTKVSFSICGDKILKSVAKFCPNLVEIVAKDSVSDKGVECLCEIRNGRVPCPKIKNISVCRSLVTDDGVKLLIQLLPLLEKLDYIYLPRVLYALYNENLSKSLKVHSYNLTEIDLSQHLPYFTDVLKACLTLCPKLESINSRVLKREQLDAFKCSNLKKLFLKCQGHHLNLDNLLNVNGCNLTFLRISNCAVSASVLAEHCPALKVIELISVHVTNVDVQLSFPKLTKCSIVMLSFHERVKIFNLFFSSSPRLEFLSFQSANLKEENFISNGSSAIKTIQFCNIGFEIKYLRDMLLNYHSLKQLLLRVCAFDVPNPQEILSGLAETLPNRPEIMYYQVRGSNASIQPPTYYMEEVYFVQLDAD